MRNLILAFAFICVNAGGYAQNDGEGWRELSPRSLSRWDVPPGNYSAITPLYGNNYAMVCDKSAEGFYVMQIEQDSITGQVVDVEMKGFFGPENGIQGRDAEGLAFRSSDSTLWISGEADQKVIAYNLDGDRNGAELDVPTCFSIDSIWSNYGFEGLTYDSVRGCFWTVTENVIRRDGKPVAPDNPVGGILRMQSYRDSGTPAESYLYRLDMPHTVRKGKAYAYGVSALWADADSSIFVLEREFDVASRPMKSKVYVSVYKVRPGVYEEGTGLHDKVLKKELCFTVNTSMRLIRPKLANFEGLCSGITLPDGRRTLLMVSDSQGGYGPRICHLRDWIQVIVLPLN